MVSLKHQEQVKRLKKKVAILGITNSFYLGVMAMPRSPVHDHYEPQTEHSYEETEAVDATTLPPG